MDRVGSVTRTVLRRAPFTVVVVVAMLVLGAATQTLWNAAQDQQWYPTVAYGLPSFELGRWWTVVSGAVYAIAPAQYLAVAGGFALMAGWSEFRLGTRRTVVAVIVGQVVGILGAAAVLLVLRGRGWEWADDLARAIDVGFSAGAMAAVSAASATLLPPWRGRLRFVLVMYCAVSLLYIGLLWDVEHAMAVVVGLALGPFLVGRRPRVPTWRLGRHEWRLLAAAWTLLVALGTLAGALFPGEGPLGDPAAAADATGLGVLGAVVVLVLVLFSDGLRRGRRVAWRWVIAICIVVVLWAVLPPYTPDSVYTGLLMLGLLVVLVAGRRAFTARGDRALGRRVWGLLGLALLALIGYALIGFSLIQDFDPPSDRPLAAAEFAARMLGSSGVLEPTSTLASVFLDSLTVLWFGFVLLSLILVLWSNRRPEAGAERERAVALLRRHGGTDLSWMITWPDNAYWFSRDGESMVAYRLHAGVAVGLCDPVAPPGALAAALAEFAAAAEERGQIPCLFSVTEATARAARQMGWRTLQVAEEAVIPLPGLEFKGKAWQDVRTALNRAAKEGVTVEVGRLAQMPSSRVRQVRDISEEWVSGKGLPEMGFTLGGVEEALDPEVRVALAVREDGTVEGVTSWLPVLAAGGAVVGWTLDVMRRREGGFRPVTEFLIASACLAFRDEGAELVSLSGAPLARSQPAGGAEEGDAGPAGLERLLDALGESMEPYYGFRSLHHFKAKFQPAYHPLYLVYPDDAALPRITVALGRAYLPDAGPRDLVAMMRS